MAEVLVRFTEQVRDGSKRAYTAQACGTIADDGLWDGWIEFVDADGAAIRSPRETKQPNRDALVYWAEGLTAAYLEGALRRARDTTVQLAATIPASEPSRFDGPATANRVTASSPRSRPVLDPFAAYEQGEGVLRQQLSALSRDHLQTLISAYDLVVADPASATDRELVEAIIRTVQSAR